jgi:O-antigen/teichoic acid export membrane protein
MQTDKIMLKLMIGDAATGIYTGAITCASMTSFVFVAIIDSMRPEIFAGKNQSQEQFENRVTELYSVIIYFSLIQCVVITALAPIIIEIMCGGQFIESVPVLRVAVWFTTFSYLGTIRNVWMLAEGNQRYLWIINLTGALTNVALNFVFIPILGALGAAVASVITQVVANVIVGYIIKPIRANNRLMVRSLNPKYLKGLISSFRRG